MYRKRMSEALQEARAYRDPVNEDRGFSTQQIKMAYGVLNDPRYKQGNYSGAVKAIEKIARGLSNHPDVANALKRANEELDKDDEKDVKDVIKGLKKASDSHAKQAKSLTKQISDETELEEALKVKYDKVKQGWFDDKGRRRYLGNAATNAIMKKKLDHAIKTGDWTEFDVSKEEIQFNLDEAFTKADFAKLEADNEHTEAAEKLINMFGTKEEKFAMAAIKARHNMTGYIKGPDYNKRQMMVNKYYSRLK